jgi:hypothetical protein
MTSQLDREIHDELVRYLAGEISMTDFRNWFYSTTWEIQQPIDQTLAEVIGEVGLRLAEFSSGHWTESELRGKLVPLVRVRTLATQIGEQPHSSYRTSSSNLVVSGGITVSETGVPGSRADIRASVEFS